ncbi:glutamine--fructose-6-phosphate transaminase (isomerizing) [Mycolicibacterium hippocampi]|uniref:Glutamine--fructose-6-phosphate aminotransferase [isomerizing] n=1 Tax=Mycolicibacterium hippocampi TaxID=659824 RepID=A0A850PSC2_9MYCO|nr:glutamine--fructose-6-phosphate transaminase (isomerizing) [Mycolicibacterium hippocampi]NVN53438.1 Glutamine--fructose-6-phosphate aminotransferase (isomerizing) [Mycolicibacterium hippocampi]
MCGIIACRTHAPAVDYLLAALRRLEYRGYDSVGVAVRTDCGGVARLRTVGRIGSLDQLVGGWSGPTLDGLGIGHTRWATHGSVTEANAHPHIDCTGRIALVHNGIIENAEQIRQSLEAAGHQFASSVDSEVLCHLIEDQRKVTGDLLAATEAALAEVVGSWAIAVIEEGTGRLVVAANRSPLLVAHTSHGDFATSDIAAIAEWVDEFRVLQDGDVLELNGVGEHRSLGDHAAAPVMARCAWRGVDTDLNGYVDYMAKEIDEQPAAAARVLDDIGGKVVNATLWTECGLPPFERLQILGCGTSLNAGYVIANLARRLGGVAVTLTVASEAADEIVEPGTLCLAISQSGETADVLRALEGRRSDGPVLALTNNPYSTLARRADAFISCAAGPEIGVAATKTFVCQVIAGAALTMSALVATKRLSAIDASELMGELNQLPEQLSAAGTAARCLVPPIAEELAEASGFLFIARGSGLPYAAEGALKLKELTYRWAEHYPAGELKHGPLALVAEGTPVIVIDNGDPKLAANVAEVSARGGRIVGIGPSGSAIPLRRRSIGPWGPVDSVIPTQILARTLALARGNDVDKPRNLAKSVTVE